jgi:hypothetical protein
MKSGEDSDTRKEPAQNGQNKGQIVGTGGSLEEFEHWILAFSALCCGLGLGFFLGVKVAWDTASENSRHNVKEHAPPPAGAHSETGVEVQATQDSADKAAGGGCRVSPCSESSSPDYGEYKWSIFAYKLKSDLKQCHRLKVNRPEDHAELMRLMDRINEITGMHEGITIGKCLLETQDSACRPKEHRWCPK